MATNRRQTRAHFFLFMLQSQGLLSSSSISSCRVTLEIMITTKLEIVRRQAQEVAMRMLSAILHDTTRGREASECLNYEVGCWLDGLTMKTVAEFSTLISDASSNSLNKAVCLGQAWAHSKLPKPMPTIAVSSVLTTALSSHSEHSISFSMLALQTASRCLLFHKNPLPLASLILYCHEFNRSPILLVADADVLVKYTGSLVNFGQTSAEDRVSLFYKMVQAYFSGQSLMAKIVAILSSDADATVPFVRASAATLAARLLAHIAVAAKGNLMVSKRSLVMIRRLIPAILQVCLQ